MAKKKTYCGVQEKVPRGYFKRGSMTECARKKGGITYYGVVRVDDNVLKLARATKTPQVTSSKLYSKYAMLRGKIKRIDRDIPYEKKKENIDKLKAYKKELIEQSKEVMKQYKEKLEDELKNPKVKKSRALLDKGIIAEYEQKLKNKNKRTRKSNTVSQPVIKKPVIKKPVIKKPVDPVFESLKSLTDQLFKERSIKI